MTQTIVNGYLMIGLLIAATISTLYKEHIISRARALGINHARIVVLSINFVVFTFLWLVLLIGAARGGDDG